MSPPGMNDVESFVQELDATIGAHAAFERLVLLKCNRGGLVDGLKKVRKAHATCPLSKASLAANLSHLEAAKQSLQWLKATDLAFLFFRKRNELKNLPTDLEKLVERLRRFHKLAEKKENFAYALARAALVRAVVHATTKPRDEEVSVLVAAVTNSDYSTEAHREWRHRHKALIKELPHADELPT